MGDELRAPASRGISKALLLAALIALGIFVIVALRPSPIEFKALPSYSVLESSRFSDRPSRFSYIDSSGREIGLSCKSQLCRSEDGSVELRYSAGYRGKTSIRSLEIDGAAGFEKKLERVRVEGKEGVRRGWILQDSTTESKG